ncbi:hypothetical protein MLDJOKPK_00146 [Salmonella phage SPAsTU]|nr:hypothetical protein MLDJOKPK_00146 [Salmonella phage SPAsTU]
MSDEHDLKLSMSTAELIYLTASRGELAEQVSKRVEKAFAQSGYGEAIRNFRTPLAQSVTQPNGKGTQLLVAVHPTSPLAKQLLTEMNWHYKCVEEVQSENIEWAMSHKSREVALVEYLRKLPWVGDAAVVRDGHRGPEVWSPNATIDVDFVIIDPGSNTHVVRFTETNVASVCKQLGIAYYQCGKKKKSLGVGLEIEFTAIQTTDPAAVACALQYLNNHPDKK